jgi:hypothetical protein
MFRQRRRDNLMIALIAEGFFIGKYISIFENNFSSTAEKNLAWRFSMEL